MSWYSFTPYVSAAERLRKAEQTAKKLLKKGRALLPVRIVGRLIAQTFWGKAWCDNLESYSDYENRLPRGRTYARNGSVLDLQISNGKIEALVQGSNLYEITVGINPLAPGRWKTLTHECAGKITNLFDLLQGRLSKDILADITTKETGLFPSPNEITLRCSCPDAAGMCKHIAGVLYGVGHRLDGSPALFFTLRGVDMQDLIAAAGANTVAPLAPASAAGVIDDANLAEIFGVDLEIHPSEAAASDSSPAKSPTPQRSLKAKAAPEAGPVRAAKKPVGRPKAKQAPTLPVKNSTKPKRKRIKTNLKRLGSPKR
jgi:uncharacterized Zn finger protein